jgi:streptogramin lyase
MRKFRVLLTVALATGIGLLGVMHAASQKSAKSAKSALLSGTVRSAGGAEEGITVSARAEGSTITTSVFTDADGLYIFPQLDNGKYQVWAQAVGLATGHAQVNLDGAAAPRQDFTLQPVKDVGRQMTGADWAASLPTDTIQDRRMKDVFLSSCAGCHQPSYPLQNRFDQAGWQKIIDLMKMVNVVGLVSRKAPLPIIEHHRTDLAAYLAKVRGPESSWKPTIVSRPKGEATMAVITEYAIEPAETPGNLPTQDGSDWSQGVPSSMNGSRGTHEVEMDLAGNIWFSTSQDNPTRTYGKIDAKTGQVTSYKLIGPSGKIRTSHGMRRDPKGIIWLTMSGGDADRFAAQIAGMANGVQSGSASLGRLDPVTGKLDIIPNPPGSKGVSNDAVEFDGKGKIWVTTNQGAMRYDPDTGKFTEFKSVRQGEDPQGMTETYGVAGDAEGNGYWTQMAIDFVDRGDVSTGKSSEIKMPPRKERMEIVTAEDRKFYEQAWWEFNSTAPWGQGPRRISADRKGNAVWVGNFWGDNLTKIDIHTNKVTQYPTPKYSGVYNPIVDKNHVVWADMMNNDSVGRFDPATGKWIEYMLPTHGAETRHIAIDDRQYPPVVAVPYSRSSKVALLRFRTKQDLQVLRAQVQTTKLQAKN